MATIIILTLLKLTFNQPYAITMQNTPASLEAACRLDENCMDLNDFEVKNDK